VFNKKVLISIFILIGFSLLLSAFIINNEKAFSEAPYLASKTRSTSIPDSLNAGKQIYDNYCVACHGANGNGEGHYANDMETKPTDFTSGMYKFKSTPYGTLPTDEDIVSTLKLGVRTTAMIPQWQLNNEQMGEVAEYVLSFAPKGEKIGKPITIPPQPGLTKTLINKGKKLFDLNCVNCHGKDLKGDGPNAQKLVNYKGKPIRPANLTEIPLKRGNTPDWKYKIINNGIEGTPMISYFGVLKPQDIWAVVYYIDSIKKEELPSNGNGMMGGGMMGRGMMGKRLVGEEYIGMRIDMAAGHSWMMGRMMGR
jgi:cytochrome c oxidase cbb3-type subunit 2